MLTNTRVFVRLLALTALLFATLAGTMLLGLRGAQHMIDNMKTLYEDRVIPLEQLAEILDLMGDIRGQLRPAAQTSDPAELVALETVVKQKQDSVADLWKAYMATYLTPEEKKLATSAEQTKRKFDSSVQKIFAAAHAKDNSNAVLLLETDSEKTFAELNDVFDKLKGLQVDVAKEVFDNSSATYSSDQKTLISLSVVAILASTLASLLIARSITTPLNRIITVMQQLTEGNLKVDVTDTQRRDEIGDVSRAVMIFKDKLAETEDLHRQQIEMTAKAEAEHKRVLLKMVDDFEREVGGMVRGVASAATQMQSTAETLASASTQTQQQASAVAAAAEQTTQNVQTVAAAAEELSASFREINQRVTESSTIINEAVSQAQSTSEQVRALDEAAQKIGTVVALITDIAEQTNLLALNATIEAARAGEAGRGFAVVASEVKTLSGQTAKATDEIRLQIGSIQSATHNSIGAINGISATIGRLNEISTSIAAAVEEQTAATGEISRNVAQAAQGTAEVTSNVGGVSEAAISSNQSATDVLSAAEQLSRDSDGLASHVNTFLNTVRTGANQNGVSSTKAV